MKKCASCTKDLPDAALHCVFCGAKQPPAAPQAMAKTVMGYDASAQIEQLRAQQAAANQRPGTPAPMAPPQPQPFPQGGAQAPTMFASGPPPMGHPGQGGPMGGGNPQPMGGQPMGGPMNQPMGGPMGAAPMGMGPPMGARPMQQPMQQPMHQPMQQPMHQPMQQPMHQHGMGQPMHGMGGGLAPIPQYQNAHGQAGAATAGRPVEPWQDSLRLLMIAFGIVLLASFLVPTSISPSVGFMWDQIAKGSTPQKLGALLIVAVGALALALSFMPMATGARGLIAGVLGLAGIAVPLLVQGAFDWKQLVNVLGMVVLVVGLLLRDKYREDTTTRIMVTVGVIAVLLPYVIPEGGAVPLVELFKRLGDNLSIGMILALAQIVLAILCLLVWLPAPSGGGAFVFAWLWILLPVGLMMLAVFERGHIGEAIKGATNATLIGWGPAVGFIGLAGYGFASAIAKKLE